MRWILLTLVGIALLIGWSVASNRWRVPWRQPTADMTPPPQLETNFDFPNAISGSAEQLASSLSIAALRAGYYDQASFTIEQKLPNGSNYQRYIVSYVSEGNKNYALLTIPNSPKPASGWPVIIFNHGYIPPDQYRTTERYVAYTDAFSRNGYILVRPDYRGHGNSEGMATGGYGSNAYTIDVLNALGAVKKLPEADPNRIGMWGHSMGGFITLRSMVTSKDVKAGVIWGGVVGSYDDLLNNWRRPDGMPTTPPPSSTLSGQVRRWRQVLLEQFGTPQSNPTFWNSISANAFVGDISDPVQLHHGEADDVVPVLFSETLRDEIVAAGKPVELFTYPGDDHNISKNFSLAINRSLAFFDEHVKNAKLIE